MECNRRWKDQEIRQRLTGSNIVSRELAKEARRPRIPTLLADLVENESRGLYPDQISFLTDNIFAHIGQYHDCVYIYGV